MYYWIFSFFSGLIFFLGLSLIVRHTPSNYKFLGVHLLLVTYIVLIAYYNLSGQMINSPYLFKAGSPIGYLFGPTYYFFILATIRQDFKLRAVHVIHFLPFLLHLIELYPFFMLSTEEKRASYVAFSALSKTSLLSSDWGYFTYRETIIFKYILALSYTFASLHAVWPVLRRKNQARGERVKKVLNWIRLDILIKILSFSIILIIFLFYKMVPEPLHRLHYYSFHLCTLFSVIVLLFFPELSLFDHLFFFRNEKVWSDPVILATDFPEPDHSPSTGLNEAGFSGDLKKTLQENYADETLDVHALARLMCLSERSLYRKTKETLGKSPSQVLLDFRMEKVYSLIQSDPEKYITQVAREVGLKSNGHFSSCFSERYGIAPREFQKKCKNPGQGLPESV